MSSSTNLAEDALQARLRDKLNSESVKLWLGPFYDQTLKVVNDAEIMALAARYSSELNKPESEVVDGLYRLQHHALEKLEERDVFKATGLATLRIKYSGFPASGTSQDKLKEIERIQIDLGKMNGKDLKIQICHSQEISENRIKLISQGKVLKEDQILDQQNIKNGTLIMALWIASDVQAFEKDEQDFRQLEETKDSVNYLANKSLGDHFSLQITDQTGKTLDLPDSEKKALAISLALHEKGRSAMKNQDFTRALFFLLEADSGFSQCQAEILRSVDNYGLLNLDIAWCYLALQSISELPSIEKRLEQCDITLQKSYGENMERVILLKGKAGWEAALFVRLHLLQGIVAYHLGQVEKASFFIGKANDEMNRLRVSDEQLANLINMGYKDKEARMALRATNGDIGAAVEYIIRRREEISKNKEHERELAQTERLQKKLGFTDNGDQIDVGLWKSMCGMGFNSILSKSALKRTNNDINTAIQIVNDPEFITSVLSVEKSVKKSAPKDQDSGASNSTSAAHTGPERPLTTSVSTELRELASEFFNDQSMEEENEEEAQRSQKAFETISKDMNCEADFIDLALSAEFEYLEKYKNLLNM